LANNVLDFVFRARLDAEVSPTKASAAATNVIKQAALRAVSPDSYSVPLPSTVSAAEILAALYNSAANAALAQTNLLPPGGLSVSVIDASHPAVVAATSSVSTMFTFPTKFLNLNLGISGVTLYDGSLFNSSSLVLVDAPAFVDRFGIWALEEALAPLALAALESEPSFDAANFEESNTMHGLNGLLFCNQKSLTVYLGLTTRW
jgi:hypothetical protein